MKKYNVFILILALLLIFLVGLDTILILTYDILPYKYLILYLVLVIGIPLILIQFMVRRKVRKPTKIICTAFTIVFIIFLSLFLYYLETTFSFLDNIGVYNYVTRSYKVLVPSDSEYQELSALNEKNIGYITLANMNYDSAVKELNKSITIKGKDYIDYTILCEAFHLGEINAFLLTDSYYDILTEDDENFANTYRIIYEFSIREKTTSDIVKDVNVTKDCYNIFISGMDIEGSISNIARSDVNIIVSINPNTNQILMIHIPRDYYVTFSGQKNKDKLTHSGLYGTETTIKTIEDLLDIDINYYFKVNFTTVVDIVNALGGVDVYSEYSFVDIGGYKYKKGYNHVDGKKALTFVRTRYVLPGGDRARGKNQEALIQAVVKKAASPAILLRYNSLLDSLKNKFMTNMSTDKITDIIKMQIDRMPNWNFTSISLDGEDSENYTSVYPERKVYVMEPNLETIKEAKEKIASVFAGKMLESSYQENNGNVNTPTIYTPPPTQTEEPKDDKTEEKNDESKDEDKEDNKETNDQAKDPTESDQKTDDSSSDNSSTVNPDQEPSTDEETDTKDENDPLEDNGLLPTDDEKTDVN